MKKKMFKGVFILCIAVLAVIIAVTCVFGEVITKENPNKDSDVVLVLEKPKFYPKSTVFVVASATSE